MLRLPLAIGIVATPFVLAVPVVGTLVFLIAGLLFGPVAILAWATAEHEDLVRDASTAPASEAAPVRPTVEVAAARTGRARAPRPELVTGL